MEEEEEEEQTNEKKGFGATTEEIEMIETRDSAIILKSRKNLKKFLEEGKTLNNDSINRLRIFSLILLIIFLAIGASNYVMRNNDITGAIEKYNLTRLVSLRLSEILFFYGKAKQLQFLASGALVNIVSVEGFTNKAKADMLTSMTLLQGFQKAIQTHGSNDEAIINVNLNSNSSSTNFNLNTASEQLITKAFTLMNSNLPGFKDSPDLSFLDSNVMNDYLKGSQLYQEKLISEQDKAGKGNQNNSMIFFIATIGIQIFSLFIILPIYIYSKQNQIYILKVFLEIPWQRTLSLKNKCEYFVSQIQIGQEDELMENDSEDEFVEELDDQGSGMRFGNKKKSKKFKINFKSQKYFIMQFGLTALLIEAYFISNYLVTKEYTDNLTQLRHEFNSTLYSNFYYQGIYVGVSSKLYNSSSQIYSSANRDVFNKAVLAMDELFNSFQIVIIPLFRTMGILVNTWIPFTTGTSIISCILRPVQSFPPSILR